MKYLKYIRFNLLKSDFFDFYFGWFSYHIETYTSMSTESNKVPVEDKTKVEAAPVKCVNPNCNFYGYNTIFNKI